MGAPVTGVPLLMLTAFDVQQANSAWRGRAFRRSATPLDIDASRGLSGTAEFLVYTVTVCVVNVIG